MRKRLRKKLINFSPTFWSRLRKDAKRDQGEVRFAPAPFYCSNTVTESTNSFYVKKKYGQVFKKKFRSKKRAVRYGIANRDRYIELLRTWREEWDASAESGSYLKYRYR